MYEGDRASAILELKQWLFEHERRRTIYNLWTPATQRINTKQGRGWRGPSSTMALFSLSSLIALLTSYCAILIPSTFGSICPISVIFFND